MARCAPATSAARSLSRSTRPSSCSRSGTPVRPLLEMFARVPFSLKRAPISRPHLRLLVRLGSRLALRVRHPARRPARQRHHGGLGPGGGGLEPPLRERHRGVLLARQHHGLGRVGPRAAAVHRRALPPLIEIVAIVKHCSQAISSTSPKTCLRLAPCVTAGVCCTLWRPSSCMPVRAPKGRGQLNFITGQQ